MTSIVQPSEDDLAALVKPYLALQAENTSLAFVIGIASPDPDVSAIYTFGGVQRQDNGPLALTEDTPFVLAYAHFLETQGPADATLGDFPELEIGEQFADITLTSLVNYSSGLPQDNGPPHDEPRLMPQPYTIPGMLGFLNYTQMKPASQLAYRYSNLGFGLMGAVLPAYADQDASYEEIVIDLIFEPLELSAQFFDEVRLDTLPQGYYFSGQSYQSAAAPGWPQFPAYHAAGGIVASPADMQVWLQFNMGLRRTARSTICWACFRAPPRPQPPAGATSSALAGSSAPWTTHPSPPCGKTAICRAFPATSPSSPALPPARRPHPPACSC